MYEKRKSGQFNTLNAIILNSAIGEEEKILQWNRFKTEFEAKTSFKLNEATPPEDADLVFIATGGAEHLYISQPDKLPSAIYAPRGTNAFAALSEIRGYLRKNQKSILCAHENDLTLQEFAVIARAKRLINNSSYHIFGDPAPWLVASTPEIAHFKAHFKTQIQMNDWKELNWPDFTIQPELEKVWKSLPAQNVASDDFMRACKLSSAMIEWAKTHSVDAISVGCFPLLNQKVSACLAVSDLLDAGYIAACENDVCSTMAMLTADCLDLALTPPWMANLVDYKANRITLQHCTIAKTGLQSIKLMTHFESSANAAIGGTLYTSSPVTVFRYNDTFTKAFIATGKITHSGPNEEGCRTSATIELDENMPAPLGNHHILIQGHHAKILNGFCEMMNIQTV